jgi:hypothetical protein
MNKKKNKSHVGYGHWTGRVQVGPVGYYGCHNKIAIPVEDWFAMFGIKRKPDEAIGLPFDREVEVTVHLFKRRES